MITGFQGATLKVLGRSIRVHVTSAPVNGRVFCRSLDDSASFGDRVGELRNGYAPGNRRPVSVRVSRLAAR